MIETTFEASWEETPGERWQERFRQAGPAYREWFLRGGGDTGTRATLRARRNLEAAMPELTPLYERLVELAGGDRWAERFLTLHNPPTFACACSQTVWRQGDRFALVRNYDFPVELSERHFVGSRWLGRGVVGTSECLWGVDDGMNDQGLAVSLTFGGSRAAGEGFGIPLILRYVLQTCRSVEEAVEALRRVPSHMAYNVTVLDREGECRTVQLHPGRHPVVTAEPHATNHQLPIDDPAYARRIQSVERLRHLEMQARAPAFSLDAALDRFLESPLHQPTGGGRFPTLYTAAYDPVGGKVVVAWPGEPRWTLGPGPFPAERRTVRLHGARAHAVAGRAPVRRWGNGAAALRGKEVSRKGWEAPRRKGEVLGDGGSQAAFEHQIQLVRCYGPGVPAGLLREIRGDIERTGRVPWERLGELWGGRSRGGCGPSGPISLRS
ncbi:MAG: C45 family peptidase [Gemmatimonadota bacterium]